jgi:phosphatidylserine/phosphatidylglycerophosphate/cardiolipin synthase-like enzyme
LEREKIKMLFKNGVDLQTKLAGYISASQDLCIFSPYIKLETLKALIKESDKVKAIFVRWEARDLIQGASDLEVYPYLKSKEIALFRNSRLHLKAYLDEYKKCFLTSANISSRALNLPPYSNYNYEIGTVVEELGIEDRLYFQKIERDSMLITDSIFKQFSEQLKQMKKNIPQEIEYNFKIETLETEFLISSLPMSYSAKRLFEIYFEVSNYDETELNCFLHDLAIYNIPFGLTPIELKHRLSSEFFSHKFISAFLTNLESTGEIYFGTAKEWIHKNCTDVPLPRKFEITTNIQILYSWIVDLGNEKYAIDQPNFSQRLYIKTK